MKIGMVVGAALVCAPVLAFAHQTQSGSNQNSPSDNQQQQQQQQQQQPGAQDTSAQQNGNGQQALTTQKLLPSDAKLIGTVESSDVRAFPEQMNNKAKQSSQKSSQIEKEGVVGVSGIDRVWQTKQPYNQAVRQLDQKLKGEGMQPVAKTTTQSSTAWNIRMPDGNFANVVVRNTKPTTIEAIQAAAVTGTVTDTFDNQQNAPSMKTKSNDSSNGNTNGNMNNNSNR